MSEDEGRGGNDVSETGAPAESHHQATEDLTAEPAGQDPRQLMRSRDDRVIAGVCGGLGRYLGVDPVLVRIAALLLIFAGGAGLVLYVIGWVAMPDEPETLSIGLERSSSETAPEQTGGAFVLGAVFVALGVFFLVDAIWADFLSWRYIWPVALIAVGVAVLLRPRR